MKLSDNAETVLQRRYYLKDADGNCIEDAEKMFRRVANAVAENEEWAKKYFRLMSSLEFLVNSPTLMNAGKENGQLSACFVIPIEDSIQGIFDAIKYAAMIHKSGGGTGFSFSRLRQAGSSVGSTNGVASGPLSFLKIFNTATEQIKQGGARRGANMGLLRVDHPDIIDFIRAKEDHSELANFNLSVGITSTFMEALEAGTLFDLIDPTSKKVVNSVAARDIWNLLVQKAWESGEPGIIFLDAINEANTLCQVGEIEATNPCGKHVCRVLR